MALLDPNVITDGRIKEIFKGRFAPKIFCSRVITNNNNSFSSLSNIFPVNLKATVEKRFLKRLLNKALVFVVYETRYTSLSVSVSLSPSHSLSLRTKLNLKIFSRFSSE